MARQLFAFTIVVPTGVSASAPQKTKITIVPSVIQEVDILVPPGPRGEVGFQIAYSGVPVLPTETGTFIVTDNEKITWPLEDYPNTGMWEVWTYNTGQFSHTLYVRLLSTGAPSQSAISSTPAPVSADQVSTTILPPAAVPAPVPAQLPPPEQVPAPVIPPAPTLPGPPRDVPPLPVTLGPPGHIPAPGGGP